MPDDTNDPLVPVEADDGRVKLLPPDEAPDWWRAQIKEGADQWRDQQYAVGESNIQAGMDQIQGSRQDGKFGAAGALGGAGAEMIHGATDATLAAVKAVTPEKSPFHQIADWGEKASEK